MDSHQQLGLYRTDAGGAPRDTEWDSFSWDALTPPKTSVKASARSGATLPPDDSWGQFTADSAISPTSLENKLVPNLPAQTGDPFLQLRFTIASNDAKSTPKLKSFTVKYRCP